MVIELDCIPSSLNKFAGRLNAWDYREEKSAWGLRVKAAVGRNKPPAPFPRAVVHIHYIFPKNTRHDPDNYAGKMILDGLVKSGVIVDDSFWCIKLELSAEHQKGVSRTVVTVQEVAE